MTHIYTCITKPEYVSKVLSEPYHSAGFASQVVAALSISLEMTSAIFLPFYALKKCQRQMQLANL